MSKWIKFNILVLSFSLLTLPVLVSAERNPSMTLTNKSSVLVEKEKSNSFSLRDFEGCWVFNSVSIGGVTGSTTEGTSRTVLGQVCFNNKGIGLDNFVSGVQYKGVVGSVEQFTTSGTCTVIMLTDKAHGIGTLTFTDPSTRSQETVDFVAIRSKESGQAIKLLGHRTSVTPTISNVTTYVLERQDQ